jgi:hypothetical protein
VPTVGAFGVRTAGEAGHAPLKRGGEAPEIINPLGIGTEASYSASWVWTASLSK